MAAEWETRPARGSPAEVVVSGGTRSAGILSPSSPGQKVSAPALGAPVLEAKAAQSVASGRRPLGGTRLE